VWSGPLDGSTVAGQRDFKDAWVSPHGTTVSQIELRGNYKVVTAFKSSATCIVVSSNRVDGIMYWPLATGCNRSS
jgi:hypothetical protein